MSEEKPQAHSHVVIPEPVRDVYLMSILAMLDEDESHKSALSVTLQIGGALVTGELIGHGRWRSELKAWLATIGGSSDVISDLVGIVEEELAEQPQSRPSHLHLRDAKFITNYTTSMNGIAPQGPERPLWRTRIADVQGWSLGRA
ncbi:hypothetical protein [Streptomyces africanus]|uniref:hypothetical protein n=1 Tax=Streptomyces africanus TaxID=231024 RepID=UPI000A3C5BB6|nr:hypothetical protein [Streptomyces africanus]